MEDIERRVRKDLDSAVASREKEVEIGRRWGRDMVGEGGSVCLDRLGVRLKSCVCE